MLSGVEFRVEMNCSTTFSNLGLAIFSNLDLAILSYARMNHSITPAFS